MLRDVGGHDALTTWKREELAACAVPPGPHCSLILILPMRAHSIDDCWANFHCVHSEVLERVDWLEIGEELDVVVEFGLQAKLVEVIEALEQQITLLSYQCHIPVASPYLPDPVEYEVILDETRHCLVDLLVPVPHSVLLHEGECQLDARVDAHALPPNEHLIVIGERRHALAAAPDIENVHFLLSIIRNLKLQGVSGIGIHLIEGLLIINSKLTKEIRPPSVHLTLRREHRREIITTAHLVHGNIEINFKGHGCNVLSDVELLLGQKIVVLALKLLLQDLDAAHLQDEGDWVCVLLGVLAKQQGT